MYSWRLLMPSTFMTAHFLYALAVHQHIVFSNVLWESILITCVSLSNHANRMLDISIASSAGDKRLSGSRTPSPWPRVQA